MIVRKGQNRTGQDSQLINMIDGLLLSVRSSIYFDSYINRGGNFAPTGQMLVSHSESDIKIVKQLNYTY